MSFPLLIANGQSYINAYGFGSQTIGGLGKTRYHVTTTSDSGAGSFRDAVSQSNRYITFDVGVHLH